jgi:hypothetical protein
MDRLTSLFEEDLALQDELEAAVGDMVGESEEIVIGVIEDRIAPSEDKIHLFESKEEKVDDEGFTEDEEREIYMAMLNEPDSEISDLLDDDDDI